MFVPMRCSVCAFKFKILQNSPVLTNVFKTHMYVFLTLYRVWYWVGLYLRRCITFLPLLPGSQLRPFLQFLYRGTIYKYEYLHPWQQGVPSFRLEAKRSETKAKMSEAKQRKKGQFRFEAKRDFMDAKRNYTKRKIPKILYRKYRKSTHFLQNGLKKTARHTECCVITV